MAGLAITAGGLSMAGQAAAAAPPALPNCPAPTAYVKAVSPEAAIPDANTDGLTSVITVADGPAKLTDVDVTTFIQHTWTGDLNITLTSPQGTTVLLKGQTDTPLPDPTIQQGENDPGVVWDRNNVFNGTIWDDQAPKEATEIVYTDDVPEATLVPEGALGAFIGENPNGDWTLKVEDTNAGDTGTLTRWQLNLTGQDVASGLDDHVRQRLARRGDPGLRRRRSGGGNGHQHGDGLRRSRVPHRPQPDDDPAARRLERPRRHAEVAQGHGRDHHDRQRHVRRQRLQRHPLGRLGDRLAVPARAHVRAPYVDGNVMPKLNVEGALAAFIGENPNGVWTLSVKDDAAGDTGTLQSWQLDIAATAGCPTPPAPTPPATTPPATTPPVTTTSPPPRLPKPTASGGAAKFTLSARQLLINQRIGQAAIRRLAAVEAKLDGKPAPTFSKGGGGKVTLTAKQLLINQRIYQAGVRRAAALEARMAGRPAPVFTTGTGGKVVLSVGQLKVNQRIAQAAVRRANALQKASSGPPAPPRAPRSPLDAPAPLVGRGGVVRRGPGLYVRAL